MNPNLTSRGTLLALLALGLNGCGGGGSGTGRPPLADPTAIVPFASLANYRGRNFEMLLPDRAGVRTGSANLISLVPGDEASTLGFFQANNGLLVSNGCSGSPELINGQVAFAVRESVSNTTPGTEPGKFYATPVDLTNQEATSFIAGTYEPAGPNPDDLIVVHVPTGMNAKLTKWLAKFKPKSQYQFIEEPGMLSSRLKRPTRDGGTAFPATITGRGYVGFWSTDAYFGATLIMRQPGQTRYLLATGHSINGYGPVAMPVCFADCVVLSDGSISPTPLGSPWGTMIGDLRYGSVIDTQTSATTTPVILTVNGSQVDSTWVALLNGDVDEYTFNYEEMDIMVDNYFKSLYNLQGTATIHIHGSTKGGLTYDATQSVDSVADGIDLNDDIRDAIITMTQTEGTQFLGDDLVSSEIDLTMP